MRTRQVTARKAGPWELWAGSLQGGLPGTDEGLCSPGKEGASATGSGPRRWPVTPRTFVPDELIDCWASSRKFREHSGAGAGDPAKNTPLSSGSQKAVSLGTPVNLIKLLCPRRRLSQSGKKKMGIEIQPSEVNVEKPLSFPQRHGQGDDAPSVLQAEWTS